MTSNSWLCEFATAAESTDRFVGRDDHAALLAAGLMGETGSILSELKKEEREREAYPAYRRKMEEEIGDFLWYYVRLVSVLDARLLSELEGPAFLESQQNRSGALLVFLDLGHAVGEVVAAVRRRVPPAEARPILQRVWAAFHAVARQAKTDLRAAAIGNTHKIQSRWAGERVYSPLFDEGFPEEEQLPRNLEVEFRQRTHGEQKVVILRCNGINFGDRITDNILDPDGYRYHDIFHFSHAVHLGWSPVVRAMLRCKRKSRHTIDEAEDGARAGILEEAIAAIVFSRAKQLKFFDGLDHVDFDLLKMVREFVLGYEVEKVPLWQWETAILDGYRVFRHLRENQGGRVCLDLCQHRISYTPIE